MIYLSVCASFCWLILLICIMPGTKPGAASKMIVENDRHTTASNETGDGDIYFKTDLDFNITYVNDATLQNRL